jgi:hypothetical protein
VRHASLTNCLLLCCLPPLLALPLQHTWNEAAVDATTGCQQSTGYASAANLNAGRTDGIRDTPPQLPETFAAGATKSGPIFFRCTGDGSFDPAATQQAMSCAAGGKLYFNNFHNIMSYWDPTCDIRRKPNTRQATFTPGQIARMRCEWRCFRMQECGGGTFPF